MRAGRTWRNVDSQKRQLEHGEHVIAQTIVQPPSTMSVDPFAISPTSLARYCTAAAMSPIVAKRPVGIFDSTASRKLGVSSRSAVPAVYVKVGATPVTTTPDPPHSSARVLVTWFRPPLEAQQTTSSWLSLIHI